MNSGELSPHKIIPRVRLKLTHRKAFPILKDMAIMTLIKDKMI